MNDIFSVFHAAFFILQLHFMKTYQNSFRETDTLGLCFRASHNMHRLKINHATGICHYLLERFNDNL